MSTVINYENIGIEGFKKQAEGLFFARIKNPAGVISSNQARKTADIAEKFGVGSVHLTIRGNMEIHRIPESTIAQVFKALKSVGVETRGATGGGVRSVSCSSVLADTFLQCQVLARKIQSYFSGNPRFEGVPKKFKIGVEGCYQDACHLIQDVCFVYSGETEGERTYDVWVGGGLGRHPLEAFLYSKHLPEKRIIPLIESVLEIYMSEADTGLRLKSLIKEKGQDEFIRALDGRLQKRKDLFLKEGFEQSLTAPPTQPGRGKLVVPVPFGQISSNALRDIAKIAEQYSGGYMVLSPNQNLVLFVSSLEKETEALNHLERNGFLKKDRLKSINFRTCPGNHECQKGLIATREIGPKIIDSLSEEGRGLKIALSGCPNSCVRPQTADLGVVARNKEPNFTVFRRLGENLGKVVHKNLSLNELLAMAKELN